MKNSRFFSSSLKSLKRSLTGAPTFLSYLSSSGYSVLLESEAPNFASLKSSPTQILSSFELFKKLLMFLSSIAFFSPRGIIRFNDLLPTVEGTYLGGVLKYLDALYPLSLLRTLISALKHTVLIPVLMFAVIPHSKNSLCLYFRFIFDYMVYISLSRMGSGPSPL